MLFLGNLKTYKLLMHNFKTLTGIAILSFVLVSCGYRFGEAPIPCQYATISVPYIINDSDGYLTQSVIRAISERQGPRYSQCTGDLILKVEIIDLCEENIGFRYDRNRKNKLTRTIIPTEGRAIAIVEVELIDALRSATILGPVRITETLDYDHDYYESRGGVNVLSLGQVTDYESARDAVQRPLYRCLANKIIEYVYESW